MKTPSTLKAHMVQQSYMPTGLLKFIESYNMFACNGILLIMSLQKRAQSLQKK